MAIETGLTDSVSLNVLLSTLGQLSDGIWENSNVANHYWEFAEAEMINDKVCLMIKKDTYDYHGGHWRLTENYFRTRLHMDPVAIKKYFANKVKAVVRENSKDYPDAGIKCNAKCDVELDYMGCYDNSDTLIKASDAYRVYKALNG
jgi:hypothetical protein